MLSLCGYVYLYRFLRFYEDCSVGEEKRPILRFDASILLVLFQRPVTPHGKPLPPIMFFQHTTTTPTTTTTTTTTTRHLTPLEIFRWGACLLSWRLPPRDTHAQSPDWAASNWAHGYLRSITDQATVPPKLVFWRQPKTSPKNLNLISKQNNRTRRFPPK